MKQELRHITTPSFKTRLGDQTRTLSVVVCAENPKLNVWFGYSRGVKDASMQDVRKYGTLVIATCDTYQHLRQFNDFPFNGVRAAFKELEKLLETFPDTKLSQAALLTGSPFLGAITKWNNDVFKHI